MKRLLSLLALFVLSGGYLGQLFTLHASAYSSNTCTSLTDNFRTVMNWTLDSYTQHIDNTNLTITLPSYQSNANAEVVSTQLFAGNLGVKVDMEKFNAAEGSYGNDAYSYIGLKLSDSERLLLAWRKSTSGSQLQIISRQNGTDTVLGSSNTLTITGGSRIKLERSGTTIKGYLAVNDIWQEVVTAQYSNTSSVYVLLGSQKISQNTSLDIVTRLDDFALDCNGGISISPADNTPTQPFADVPVTHENIDAIRYMKNQRIFTGYGDNTFRPSNYITRGEITKVIVAAQYSQAEIDACTTTPFPDIYDTNVFKKHICLAKQKGVINGYSDGYFHPDNEVTFAQFSKIFCRTLGLQFTEDPYNWARVYGEFLASRNAIPTNINCPSNLVTRATIAEIVYRILSQNTSKQSRYYSDFAYCS